MPAAHEKRTIDVRGYQVLVGIGGNGPPLLYLHGFGDHDSWLELHERLARSFTVYVPRHPGFAGTPLPDWFQTAEDLAFHYVDLLSEIGVEHPIVVGSSLGGWIATELAIIRPALPRRLILVGALGLQPKNPPPDIFIMEPDEDLPFLFAAPRDAPAASGDAAEAFVGRWENLIPVARLMWQRPYDAKLPHRLHHVTAPTLVIWRGKDRFLPPSHGEMLAAKIAGARHKQIDGAGHLVALEQPSRLAEAVIAFAAEA
jgi:pimeloyl-ACP methyl ester carboxylesterase